jgi:four helix bundle protein
MKNFDQAEDLKARTKRFAIKIVQTVGALKRTLESRVLGMQVLRSGTSLAANYRAVCRARSRAEFIAKLGIVVEETDETIFWLDLMADTNIVTRNQIDDLLKEAHELLAIFSASRRTAKSRRTNI